MNRRITLNGNVEKVGAIEGLKRGFRQSVIIHEPSNDDRYPGQFFPVQIYSDKQTDSRFLDSRSRNKSLQALCYLKGQRWTGQHGFNYNIKLDLIEWV